MLSIKYNEIRLIYVGALLSAMFGSALSSNDHQQQSRSLLTGRVNVVNAWYEKGVSDFRCLPDMREDVPAEFVSKYDEGIQAEKDECRRLARQDAVEERSQKLYRYSGLQYRQNVEKAWGEVADEQSKMCEKGEEYGKRHTTFEKVKDEGILAVDVDEQLLAELQSKAFTAFYFKQMIIEGSKHLWRRKVCRDKLKVRVRGLD